MWYPPPPPQKKAKNKFIGSNLTVFSIYGIGVVSLDLCSIVSKVRLGYGGLGAVISGGARGGAGGAAASSMSESARPAEVTRPPSPLPDLHPSSSTSLLSYFLLSSVVEPIHFDPAQASATDL